MNAISLLGFLLIAVQASTLPVSKDTNLEPVPQPLAQRNSVPEAPKIVEQPTNQIVKKSASNVRLYCRATGFPNPVISWLKEGKPVNDQGIREMVTLGDDLMLLRIIGKGKDANTGTYQCVAQNTVGSTVSRNASVQIASIKDEFRLNPIDTVASVGGTTTLECEGPRGTPQPTISWKKDGKAVQTDDRIQIRNGNLIITRAQKSDHGDYECVASNLAGTKVSAYAVLMVQVPPRIVNKPQTSNRVTTGQNIELNCVAEGEPLPNIKWLKNGGQLPSGNRISSLNNGNLLISQAQSSDQGQYTCVATNRAGKDTATAYINVQPKTSFSEISPDQTVKIGETVTLRCRASGNPQPAIIWRDLRGKEMFVKNSYYDSHMVVSADGDLIIYNVNFNDAGTYKCTALGGAETITAFIQVTVQPRQVGVPPPVIRTVPLNTTVVEGGVATFTCNSVVSTDEQSWLVNKIPLQSSSIRPRQTSSAGTLQITEIQISDAGRYTCKVTSDYGVATWDAFLTVLPRGSFPPPKVTSNDLPSAPLRIQQNNATDSSIGMSWDSPKYNGNSEIIYYAVEYYRIGGTSISWEKSTEIRTRSFVARALLPSSQYVFLVRAVNRNAIGEPSATSKYMKTNALSTGTSLAISKIKVALLDAVPLADPTTGTGSVRIRWNSDSNCNDLDGFKIFAKPLSSHGDVITVTTTCANRAIDIDHLKSGVVYDVRIRPYRGQLSGTPSPIEFVSLQNGKIQPIAPILFTKTSPKTNSITFSWAPPNDIPSDYVTGYKLNCHSGDDQEKHTLFFNSTSTQTTLSNLEIGTTYFASLTYMTPLGDGVTSSEEAIALGVVITEDPTDGGFVDLIQSQPAVIAGVAIGLLIIIALVVGGICYYKKSKRSRKARGLHGKKVRSFSFTPHTGAHRNNIIDRFDSPYTAGFQMTPTVPAGVGNVDEGTKENLPRSEHDVYHQQSPTNIGAPTNVTKNAVIFYNAKNGNTQIGLDEKPTNHGSFSYVADQLTSKTDIPPQFSTRPSIVSSQSSVTQQLQQHQQQLIRQCSGSSNLFAHGTNSTVSMEQDYPHTDSSQNLRGELPPPPPSPPLSQRTAISDRSRTSSNMHSTGSRSGQRARRTNQRNRLPSTPKQTNQQIQYFPIENSNHHSPQRSEDYIGSPTPPVPPIRGASYPHKGQSVLQFNSRDPTLNLGYLAGPSDGETDGENDQVGQLRNFNQDLDPRNSVAVSAVSMMNAYGSELESDHGSDSNVSSDDDSLHMESASQVGPNILCQDPQPQPRAFKQTDQSPNRSYQQAFTHNVEIPLLPDNNLSIKAKNRKQGSKPRRTTPKKTPGSNIARSETSSSSSYQQNTGDSGMSAGVGCSTEHSSLGSSASAGSAGKNNSNKVGRSRTTGNLTQYENVGPPHQENHGHNEYNHTLDAIRPQDDEFSPVSPTASEISEQSGYNSTASSCWQYHQQQPRRPPRMGTNGKPVTPQRPKNFADSVPLNFNNSQNSGVHSPNYGEIPSPISSDLTPIISDYDVTPTNMTVGMTQFQVARANFADIGEKPSLGKTQHLSDVPEVLTSDFCEDYSDQSQ